MAGSAHAVTSRPGVSSPQVGDDCERASEYIAATAGTTMRVMRRRRRVDQRECRAVIESVTTLCGMANFAWRLERGATVQGFVALSEQLEAARREGRAFALPDTARSWFDLRYADPDAAYALAIVLLWAFGASRGDDPRSEPDDYVSIAVWHLQMLLPPSTHAVLPDIADAYLRHRASLRAQVGL
ncbi:hypothetical protein ACPFP2_01580 [Micromonospora citrea]|uniref:hypothetical protein n=1 Tax=Micromonospora citrea TaxID=47855 RepID=UPI003C50018E